MKSLTRHLLIATAGFTLAGATAVQADPFGAAPGDLILGVQATGGTGSTTNVLVNLGPAHALRDDPSPGALADIDDELTAAFGAAWSSRDDLFFGVFANRNNSPAFGLGSAPPENGDPSRTIYASRGTPVPGSAAPWTGFTSSALGIAATAHQGQVSALAPLNANANGVLTLIQANNPVQWNNGWTEWNPTPGSAFSVFGGGIQAQITDTVAHVDVFRILGSSGSGTYITTVSLSANGEINASSGGPAPSYFTVTSTAVNGTVNGSGAGILYADGSTARLTAVANSGFGFTGWSGDATGTDNPIDLVMDGNKTVTATFAPFPSVASPTATDITDTEVTLGATVSSDGGSTIVERGVVRSVRSVNSNPVIDGSGVTKVVVPGTLGVFDTGVTGLAPATTYSYKGYATSGVGTSYTAVAVFTTDTELVFGAGNTATLPDRSILAGDSHGFSFSLATGRQVLITSGGSTAVTAELFDSNGNSLATKTGAGLLNFDELLDAGDYYLLVSNPTGTSQSFSLGLDASSVISVPTSFPAISVNRGALNSRNARPVRGSATVLNVGNLPDQFRVGGRRGNRFFRPRYISGGNVTAQISNGTFTTDLLVAGGAPTQISFRVIPNRKSLTKGGGTSRRILRRRFNITFQASAVSNPGAAAAASVRIQTR